eukprot:g3286.t1
MTTCDNDWLDSLSELQLLLEKRQTELQEQSEKRCLLQRQATAQRNATREVELRHLELIEKTARSRKETLDIERKLDSEQYEAFSSSDPRWVKYKNNVAKQTEKMKSLYSAERANIDHFTRMTEKHFSAKYQDLQNQQSFYEKERCEIEFKQKERIVPKEMEISRFEHQIRDIHQQNLSLKNQLNYLNSQRRLQEANYHNNQQRMKEENHELQRVLNRAWNERNVLLQELDSINTKYIRVVIFLYYFLRAGYET